MGRPRNPIIPWPTPRARLLLGCAAKSSAAFLLLQLAAGCSRAPTFNVLGSFFPSWILCGILGILLASAARIVFLRAGLEPHMAPLVVVYPCLAALFTFVIWLLFFS